MEKTSLNSIFLRIGNFSNFPPETITDNSPLIRVVGKPEHLIPATIGKLIHCLYAKANLIALNKSKRYQYRDHSIRKFFKTQLSALGVNQDYIEYKWFIHQPFTVLQRLLQF